jgi:sterol 24-C-methyltransferase
VKVGNRYCAEQGLADTCRSQQGDFQKLDEKFAESSFDAAYEIEATCHSPDRVQTFGQVRSAGACEVMTTGGVR